MSDNVARQNENDRPPPGESSRRRWLLVVEEAHNVLDRSFEERRPADESNAGRGLLRCIDRLLQEGRELEIGVMVVDQSPTRLARSVISNTGTKIIMRLEDGAEMEEIGRAIGLEEEEWKKLGFLQEGEAVVKASYMDTPVKTARFIETTSQPACDEPQEPGTSPHYERLRALCQDALYGEAESDDWQSELLDAATGSAELAMFAMAKAELAAFRDLPGGLAATECGRALLAHGALDADRVLSYARKVRRSSAVRANQEVLGPVSQLMFGALIPWPAPDRRLRIDARGIELAAELLQLAGTRSAPTWRALLSQLAGGARWLETVHAFSEHCRLEGGGDVTAALALLLSYCNEAVERDEPACASAESSGRACIRIMLRMQELVNRLTQIEGSLVDDRAQVVVELLTRRLCADAAQAHGSATAEGMRALWNERVTHAG